jgi:hypothetical protein
MHIEQRPHQGRNAISITSPPAGQASRVSWQDWRGGRAPWERFPPVRTEDLPTQREAHERKRVLQRAGLIACVTPTPLINRGSPTTNRGKPRHAGNRATPIFPAHEV